jgi:penicillin-binding protein 1C
MRNFLVGGVLLTLAIGGLWLESRTRPGTLIVPQQQTHQSSESHLFDRSGLLLHSLRASALRRQLDWTPLNSISPALKAAVILAEDRRFYSHSGVDLLAFSSAAMQNLKGQPLRGASTITMQLAGLLQQIQSGAAQNSQFGEAPGSLNRRRSVLAKLSQMRAAWSIERQASKDQILEAYLNTLFFRGELQGISAASMALMGKQPIGLNQREAAVLASLIASPQAKPARVAQRACQLITRLERQVSETMGGPAGPEQPAAQTCEPELMPVSFLNRPQRVARQRAMAPHLAVKLLRFEPAVTSTIDARIQRLALRSLQEHLRELQSRRVEDGAVVVLHNPTGQVLAYVGSSGEYSEASEVDAAVALRQAGSTLKPFIYALAIERHAVTAASLLDDSALAISTGDAQYQPQNFNNEYRGWVSVRQALGSSLNIPAVRTLAMLDLNETAGYLKAVGLHSLTNSGDHYGYSLALGSADVRLIDLTNAYRTLANHGLYSPVSYLLNPPKETIRSHASRNQSHAVLSVGAVQIVNDILADNNARALTFGLDSALRTPFKSHVKTGTSKDMRDNWCIGFTEEFTVGVWVGNASGAPMRAVSGVSGAAPIWREIMVGLNSLRGDYQAATTSDSLHRPSVLSSDVLTQTVRYLGHNEPPRQELFLAGTQTSLIQLEPAGVQPTRFSNAQQARILQPLNGAIYSMDPDIPLKNQRLKLQANLANHANGQAFWLLNGQRIRTAESGAHWADLKLTPGRHLLSIVDAKGRALDAVRFEVRAPSVSR